MLTYNYKKDNSNKSNVGSGFIQHNYESSDSEILNSDSITSTEKFEVSLYNEEIENQTNILDDYVLTEDFKREFNSTLYNIDNNYFVDGLGGTKNKILYPIEKRLISIITNSYFEAGIWTEADQYFADLITKFNTLVTPLSILSNIVNHNLNKEHILEGVLHILSNYKYDDITPFGISISIACTVNHSPIIQDLLISNFENWNSVDAISILEGLELEKKWLIEYRDEVLNQLRAESNNL